MFYAPPALGGSKEEAVKSYSRAASLLSELNCLAVGLYF
jgi:hypothetical protein